MESLKSLVGLGGTTDSPSRQEGQEPVSGMAVGEGTADAPFDAGNRVDDEVLGGKAAQHVHPNSDHSPWLPDGDKFAGVSSGQEPVSGVTGAGTADQPYDAGNQVNDPVLGGKAARHTNTNNTVQAKALEQSGQEPISGVTGAGTVDEPYDSGNKVDDVDLGGKAPQHTSPIKAQNASAPSQSDTKGGFVSSFFTNPFGKRESISAAPEADLDPKAALSEGEHRNAPLQHQAVVEPALPFPKREKGKGKMMYDTDSTSSRTQQSDTTTRAESIATSHTGRSTMGTPGGIPTAGGIPLGERARIDRERRASLRPSTLSSQGVKDQPAEKESLQRVTEAIERRPEQKTTDETSSPLSALPPVSSKFSEQVATGDTPPSTATNPPSAVVTPVPPTAPATKTDVNTTYSPEPAGERRRSSAVGRLASSIGRKLSVRNKEAKQAKAVRGTETIQEKK